MHEWQSKVTSAAPTRRVGAVNETQGALATVLPDMTSSGAKKVMVELTRAIARAGQPVDLVVSKGRAGCRLGIGASAIAYQPWSTGARCAFAQLHSFDALFSPSKCHWNDPGL